MLSYLLTHSPLLYLVQSFWRDEAFSVLAAEKPLGFIISKLGFEPPVYYVLLHFWIKLFGQSDIAARCLSLLGFILATWLIIAWAEKLYKSHWLSFFLPIFFFLNPMLLYYAFEVRTYAWYTFFAVATLFTYSEKRWRWFTVSAILGFYTHVYLLLYLAVLFTHWIITSKPNFKHIFRQLRKRTDVQAFGIIGLALIPWLIKITTELSQLKHSWYFPVGRQLIFSVLGNMFTGYEGTPWYGWRYTAYVSLALVGLAILALTNRTNRKRTLLFVIFGAVPLIIIIGISFMKPLFVNRYLIPSTVAEVLVVAASIRAIRARWLQRTTAAVFIILTLWFNWWFPPQHPKVPIRPSMDQVNMLLKPTDIILADNAIIYLETLYYAKDRSRVYVYDPRHIPFPWYIGSAVVPPSRLIDAYPVYPSRAFLVHPDASFQIVYAMPIGTR